MTLAEPHAMLRFWPCTCTHLASALCPCNRLTPVVPNAQGSFYTDHDQVQDMCARIENLYLAWMQGLNSFVALNQRTSVGPSIGQRSSTSQSAASYPLQQQPPMHTKSQPDLYSSKYSGPDSGGSTRGETVSALHAQMSQAPLHPNPNFLMQAPATRGLTAHHHALLHPPDLQQPHHLQQAQLQEQLLQQQQQLELNRPLSDQEAFGPMAATVASSQPQGFAEAQARLYPGVVGPHSASLPTPFASAPAQGADMLPPLTASDNPTSPTRLRPPKSQSSLDGHSGRHARRIVTDLLSRWEPLHRMTLGMSLRPLSEQDTIVSFRMCCAASAEQKLRT